jgi:predicted dinucleotide-binding enzyme
MQVTIMGTGHVATTLASSWASAGHDVVLGSRDPSGKAGLPVTVAPLVDAVAAAGIVVNATPGAASLDVVEAVGREAFAGKVLVDVANASTKDFELIFPNSSLAEQLQAALPESQVVKTMNTAAMTVMTEPSRLGPSTVFVSGDDEDAKATVHSLLTDLGWSDDSIVDLGAIRSARGPEHYFAMFATLMQALRTPEFNIRLVRGPA